MKRGIVLGVVLVALAAPPNCAWAIGEFYENRAEGWFWYRLDSSPLELQTQPNQPELSARQVSPISPETQPLSAAWFRENFPKYKDAAIDNPTPANIAAYLYLQRVMMDKANRFSDSVQQVVVTDPYLDEVTRRPIATFAANEVNRETGRLREDQLRLVARRAGIFFFFRSDCRYCDLQAPVLARLADAYGFEIYPISLDGRPMPNGLFRQFRVDQGQARKLGVVSTPAMFLAQPPDKFIQIAQGAVSMEELVSRILMVAVQAGWLDEKDYQQTRPLTAQTTFYGAQLPGGDFPNPEDLVEYLRNAVRSAP